ncbi:MAG: hypothetical protein WHU10_05320 [Fimbriimonadales bacterium]
MAARTRKQSRLAACDRAWALVQSDPLAGLLIAGASGPEDPTAELVDEAEGSVRAWNGVLGPRDRADRVSMLCYLANPPKPLLQLRLPAPPKPKPGN